VVRGQEGASQSDEGRPGPRLPFPSFDLSSEEYYYNTIIIPLLDTRQLPQSASLQHLPTCSTLRTRFLFVCSLNRVERSTQLTV
jgi:hypothetical protein